MKTKLKQPITRLCLLMLPLASLLSCSPLADINRHSRELPKGATVAGNGFTVRVPRSGLYSSLKDKKPGDVILRPVKPSDNGLVYLVRQFAARGAATPREALDEWNKIPRSRGVPVILLKSAPTRFKGLPAMRADMELLRSGYFQVASALVVKRSPGYLILSTGHPNSLPMNRKTRQRYTSAMLRELQNGFALKKF